jgi:hypothetical protein
VARGCGMVRGGETAGGGTMGRACGCCFLARAAAMCSLLAVREKQEGGRREERKKKMKEKKNKNMEFFQKIKDNLRNWSKNIFVQKSYMSNYK